MTQQKIKTLKEKLEHHYHQLEKKHPMTKIVIESINSFLEMDAPDDLIRPWYSSIFIFIRDIEKEIQKLENKERSDNDTTRDHGAKRKDR